MLFFLPLIATSAFALEGILPNLDNILDNHEANQKWERLLFKKEAAPKESGLKESGNKESDLKDKGIHEALEKIRLWKQDLLQERAKHMHEMMMQQAKAEAEHLKEVQAKAAKQMQMKVSIPDSLKARLSAAEQDRIKQMAMRIMMERMRENPDALKQPNVIVFRLRRKVQPVIPARMSAPVKPKIFLKVVKIHDRLVVDEHEHLKEHTADVDNEVYHVEADGTIKPLFKNHMHMGMKKKPEIKPSEEKMHAESFKKEVEEPKLRAAESREEEDELNNNDNNDSNEEEEPLWKKWIDQMVERARKGETGAILTIISLALVLVFGVAAIFTVLLMTLSPVQSGYHHIDDQIINYPANSAPLNNPNERTPLV